MFNDCLVAALIALEVAIEALDNIFAINYNRHELADATSKDFVLTGRTRTFESLTSSLVLFLYIQN